MEMAFQDLAHTSSPEEQQIMRQDMEQNIGHYIRENFQALQRMAANGDIATHVLDNMHHIEVHSESLYDWDNADASQGS